MIIVRRAPVYATVQDTGRRGFMASGVPRAGAMDLPALNTLNALLGNNADDAAIEWALTGGELELTERTVLALAGATAAVRLNDRAILPYRAEHCNAGDVLTIDSISDGRFLYVAFAGGIDTPAVMHSRSTYVPGGFGGIDGRRLKNGDALKTGRRVRARHQVTDPLPSMLRPPNRSGALRFVPRDKPDELTLSEWTLSPSSDRTGYRLAGQGVIGGASIVSEPVCPGVIQLPPGGVPIVLMADAPTIGGYRILGTVITADLPRLAQLATGFQVSFESASVELAQREIAAENERLDQVREWTLG